MIELTKALIAVQKEIQDASKDSDNAHYRSGYASLESVLLELRRVLPQHGFSFSQYYEGLIGGTPILKTVLLHSSGERIESSCPLILQKNDMQGLGAATTYARRYSLVSLVGIGQQDDDAVSADMRNGWPKGKTAQPPEADLDDVPPEAPVNTQPKAKPKLFDSWTNQQMKEYAIAKYNVPSSELGPVQRAEVLALSQCKPFRVAMNDLGIK